jgi:hypothetical protein
MTHHDPPCSTMLVQARIVTSDTLNEPGGGLQFHEDDSVQVTRGQL